MMDKHWKKLQKLFRILETPYYLRALMKTGTASSTESEPFLKTCAPDLIVDVGANRGQFSLAARHWHPQAQIIAFEPLTVPAGKYTRLFDGDDGVTLHKVALSQVRGDVEMHVAQRDDSSSLLSFSSLQKTIAPGNEEIGRETVKSGPLVDFVPEAELSRGRNLLKLDVQGSELEVLMSAASILKRFDWICAEASFFTIYEGQPLAHEIIGYLAGHGFKLAAMFNVTYVEGKKLVLQADMVFENAGRGGGLTVG